MRAAGGIEGNETIMNEYGPEEVERLPLEEPEAARKRKLMTRLKWLLLAIVVLVLVGIPSWFLFLKPAPEGIVEVEPEMMKPERKPPQKPPEFGEVYLIEDLIINSLDGRRHFMVSIGLEYFDKEKLPEIERREPLLRDNLITLFSSQPVEVLTNITYRQALRARVKKIMDYQLGEGVVTRVFFQSWVSE